MDMKKEKDSLNLDFDSLSGGVEEKKVSKKVKAKASTNPDITKIKNDYHIPVYSNGKYTMKNLSDVTGDEFLEWVHEVYPSSINRQTDPDRFDGASKLEAKKEAINFIASFYQEIMTRKGYKLETLH